jgi:hypothetical protein
MMFVAPRTYEAGMMYALVTPKVPTATEIEEDPSLGRLNSDNPYLRSSDNSLLSQVLVAKMGTPEIGAALQASGLGTEYRVAQASTFGSGMLLQITASGDTPEIAVATANKLGEEFVTVLRDAQTINGADERFLFSALQVDGPGPAKEVVSSRLRAVIMTGVGGLVGLFGLVSVARSWEIARDRKRSLAGRQSDSDPDARGTARRMRSSGGSRHSGAQPEHDDSDADDAERVVRPARGPDAPEDRNLGGDGPSPLALAR